MKKINIMLVALLVVLTGLRAQETKSNSLGLSWGFGSLKRQDLIFSPFVHQDRSPMNVILDFERSAKVEQRVYFRYGHYSDHIGDLFDYGWEDVFYPKLEHSFTMVDLNYSLGTELAESEKWTFLAGGRLRNRFQISYYDYGPSASFAYYIPIGLDLWFRLGFKPAVGHHLEMNLNLPLFSYVARSPYMGQDDDYLERISVHGDLKIFLNHLASGELQSWGTSQMADLELRYQYDLSERWELGAAYLFSLNMHTSPLDYKSYEHLFSIGTTFKF